MLNAPTKPCHNCRRRRLRCDRSYPHCHKCTVGGQECLGYGKLFRWTEGVASRGKLAGKTSITFSADTTTAMVPTLRTSTFELKPSASSSPASSASGLQPQDPPASAESAENDSTALVVSAVRPAGTETQSAPWTLVDPLFQGVEHHYRHYLSYCNSHLLIQSLGKTLERLTRSLPQSPPASVGISSPGTSQTGTPSVP